MRVPTALYYSQSTSLITRIQAELGAVKTRYDDGSERLKKLTKLLAEDRDLVDFGKHLVPWAVSRDNVYAYPFEGYWRDVGTIQAYWEANMDLLAEDPPISPEAWGIRPNLES